ncbi:MAG TPA: VanZ family protein [Candidatus Polarisedimenticolia bacterium]|nr:VanZ family protein [Candidatus Polarisedimenticolia bacterium]
MTPPAPTLGRRVVTWGPAILYLVVIYYVSAQPQVGWATPYPDKLLHVSEYLVLAVLLARALNNGIRRPVPMARLLLTWGLCAGYAVTDEIHQVFVPGRSPDVRDALADACGAALGLLMLQAAQRAWLRRRPASEAPAARLRTGDGAA